MGEKIKVEELGCFKEVADVIEVTNAKVELYKTIKWTAHMRIWDLDGALINAFSWWETPQGHNFWENIYYGRNPYEN